MLRSNVTRLLASAPLVAMVAITAPHIAHAQNTTGTVHGVVKDPSGKPFKSANVTLTAGGGTALKATTNSAGEYTFIGVQPGNYTVHIDVQSYAAPDQAITVIQDQPITADFSLAESTVDTGTTKVTVRGSGAGGSRAGQSNTQVNVSARIEQLTKSQPNNLYQFPGLVFGQPGITPDPSGYTHIRGSDFNQVGFSVDGIDITDPMTNSFGTNLVTVGLKSASIITGGADASYGGKTGGFINEVTQNGRDLVANGYHGTFEYTAGPSGGWGYNGTRVEYGNILAGGKFDYYASEITFENKFPGNTQIYKVYPSNDELLKLNYYIDPKNTVTGYINNGAEHYDEFENPSANGTYKMFDYLTGKLNQSSDFVRDHDNQGYALSYLTYKHNFSDTSFATLQQYKLYSRVRFNLENLDNEYEDRESTKSGTKLDYTNQFGTVDRLQAGISYTPEQTHYRVATTFTNPLSAATSGNGAVGSQFYQDFSSAVHPTETTLYLNNQVRLLQNKATIDTGVRYSQQYDSLIQPNLAAAGFTLPAVDSEIANRYTFKDKFAPHYVDPRVGLTYSPTVGAQGLTFRTSYGVNSQFADTQLLNRIPTYSTVNGPFNSAFPGYENASIKYVLGRYAPFNNIGPAHGNDFDLGVQKAFLLNNKYLSGAYDASLTGFRRAQYDLIQYERASFSPLGGARYYDNQGHGHSSGVELQLNKRLVNQTDWNGFVTYTNQNAVATSSDFDTGYQPYTYFTDAGDPNLSNADYLRLNQNEYSTSYDQKHTVGAVVNKKFFKFLASSLVLDAGSGFPFAGGSQTDGSLGEGADSQHSEKAVGGANFNEVPTVLLDGSTLQPINPVVGRTGWHYKFSLNTDLIVREGTTAFLNIDNLFTRNTPLTYATATQAGQIYYNQPSAAYPQGRVYYGASTIITPRFISFGIRTKF